MKRRLLCLFAATALLQADSLLVPNLTGAFGLANPSAPASLNLVDRTLADIGFASGLSDGTVLEFRVSDINFGDNSGAFEITQAAVPEPGNITLLGLGMVALALARWRNAQGPGI